MKFGNSSFSSTSITSNESNGTSSSCPSNQIYSSSACKISPIEYDNPDTSSKYSDTSKGSADLSGKPHYEQLKHQHGVSQKKSSQLSPIHEGIVHQMYDYLQTSQQANSKLKNIPHKPRPTTKFSFSHRHDEEDEEEHDDMLDILSSTLPTKANLMKSNPSSKRVLGTIADDWKFKKSYTSSEDEEDSQHGDSASDEENMSKNSSSKSYQPTSEFQKLKKSNTTNAKNRWFKFKSNIDDEEEDDNSEHDDSASDNNNSDTTSSTTDDEEETSFNDKETISMPLTFDTSLQKDTDFNEDFPVVENSLMSLDNLDKREMLTLFLLQHVSRQYNPDPNFFISLLRRLHKEGYLTDTRFLDQKFLKQTCKHFMKDVVENWPIAFVDNSDHTVRTSPRAKTTESFSSSSSRLKHAGGLSRSESYHSFLSTAGHENMSKQPATLLTSLPLFDPLFFSPSRYKSDFHHKQRIGRGAFGVVFVCKHKIDGHYYAIKKIKFSFRDKSELKEVYGQVIREVRALAALDHPRIVRYNQAWFEPNRNGMHDDEIPHNTEFEDAEESIGTRTNHDRSVSANLQTSESSKNFEHTSRDNDFSSGFGTPKSPLSYDMDSKQIAKDYPNTISFESSESGNLVPTSQPTLGVGNIEYSYSSPPNNMSYLEFALEQKREPYDTHLLNTLRDMFNPKNQKFEMVLFIQMQLCNPHTLEDWLWSPERSQEKKLDHAEALNFFSQICDGIKHVHSRGVIHRDLKPSNIFLTSDNTIKIGDFGLAKYCLETLNHTRANAEQHDATTSTTDAPTPHRNNNHVNMNTSIISSYGAPMSPTHAIDHTVGVGTYFYASPEQLSHSQYNEKADIYSLGVILFELLHPFGTKSERAFVLKDLKNGIIPESMCTKFPEEMAIVKQCIDENPDKRPTAAEIFDRITLLTKKINIKKSIKSLNPPHLERKSSFGNSSSFITTDLLKEKNRVIEEQQKEIERLKQLLQQQQVSSSTSVTTVDKSVGDE